MSRKIFHAIWIVTLAVFLASLTIILGVLYSYFSNVQRNQLRIETQLAARGVELGGTAFFDGFREDDYRITWITADGTVLYDNEADTAVMENHLEREEIRQALAEGSGESARYSRTLSEKQLYFAQRLPDGSVLRLAATQATVWRLLLGLALPVVAVFAVALGLSFILASRLSKRIVEPINSIDLDDLGQYVGRTGYAEVEPLLQRLDHQKEQIRLDQAELEKTSLIRQEFTANVSHELKTPLHVISGYAELIESGMVKAEDVRPFAGKIRSESGRMTKLVEDIIDLTKLDSGGIGMQWETADLYTIAENAIDSLSVEAEAANVTLVLEGERARLRGVQQYLYSIVYNLCDNAIKYSAGGGRVTVRTEDLADRVRLTVSDTGIGIPPEHRDRIFERFYRVDKSRSKEVGGTGLGLSIVKHAARLHRAAIGLQSVPGEGSVFTITFPKTASSPLENANPSDFT